MKLPDLTSAAFKANPFPTYARLRAESPVYCLKTPQGPAWLVTRHADVEQVLKDIRLAKDPQTAPRYQPPLPWQPRFDRVLNQQMLAQDPPNHTRLRALVSKAFTPRFVELLRDRIQEVTDRFLKEALAQKQVDLVRDFAFPIPVTVIAEMLGVPAEDRRVFARWSRRMASTVTALDFLRALPAIWAFERYTRRLVTQRRASPREDLISALIRAEENGAQLSEDELVAMVLLLLIAGHETTANLIATGTLALLDHPDQLERFRSDPTVRRRGIEELLRYSSPVDVATSRFSSEELSVAGQVIPKGELVLAFIGSANRDETVFSSPDQLDLSREPNRHLAFGYGAHYCLGAPLARLEGEIALTTLLQRVPRLKLAVPRERLLWRPGILIRGLVSLPVFVG